MPQIALSVRRPQTPTRLQAPDQDFCAKPRTFKHIKYTELMRFAADWTRPSNGRSGNSHVGEVRAKGCRA